MWPVSVVRLDLVAALQQESAYPGVCRHLAPREKPGVRSWADRVLSADFAVPQRPAREFRSR
jgi:hypothetical protein